MGQFLINPEKHLNLHLSGGVNNTASSASIGGSMSWNAYMDSSQLFKDVPFADRSAGKIVYRGVFFANLIHMEPGYVENVPGEFTLKNVKVWIDQTTSGTGEDIYIGTNVIPGKQTGSFTMWTLSTESNNPGGVSFVGYGSTLSLGDYATNTGIGVWIKRSASAGCPAWKNSSASIAVSAEVVSGVQLI